MMPTPTPPLIISSACPHAPASSAPRACVLAAISPSAPPYVHLSPSHRPPPNISPQLDPRVTACVAYFATDIHSRTLGPHDAANTSADAPPSSIHTLDQFGKFKGEAAMIFGVKDTHVPDAGRDLIRAKMRAAGVVASFHEFAWAQHAFIRDELSKGRYDPAVTKVCFEVLLEVFGRVLKTDLGVKGNVPSVEHDC